MSQTALLQQLRQETDPAAAQKIALELLDSSRRREMIDAAMRTLEEADLDDSARAVLRRSAWHYFERNRDDTGGLLREKLLRMLGRIGHPDDKDLYLRGLATYEIVPMMGEVTQNVRAVALVALALNDPDLAAVYATKLLSEIDSTSQFNGEPAVTAINLLNRHSRTATIYQYLLLGGLDAIEAGQNEVVGKALESLGAEFPVALYRELIDLFAERDRAMVNMGIITHIVDNHVRDLYPVIDDIMNKTRHDELHHYGAVMLAASRNDELIEQLYAQAKLSPLHRIPNYIEALELIPGDEKAEMLVWLQKRQAKA